MYHQASINTNAVHADTQLHRPITQLEKRAAYLWTTVYLQVRVSSVPRAPRGKILKSLLPGGQQECARPNRKLTNQHGRKRRISV